MIINSSLPPVCIKSVIDGQWYIVTTDASLGWVKVDRRYDWEELNQMWVKKTYNHIKKENPKRIKENYKIEGSKGSVYKVVNDEGKWSCSCPSFGWSRGRDCKHIKQLKIKI